MVALFADFFAYADPQESEAQRSLMAPQPIHWFDEGSFRPYVYALEGDPRPHDVQAGLRPRYEQEDPDPFFGQGDPYRIPGLHPDWIAT